MTQRRLILFAGSYLAATALAVWLAFAFGHSRGASVAAAADPEEYRPSAYVDVSENVWSCDQFRGFPGLRANHRERVCGPGDGFAAAEPRHGGVRPLQHRLALNIAGAEPSLRQAGMQVPGIFDGPHDGPAALFDPSSGAAGGIIASASGANWTAPGGGGFFGQPAALLAGPGSEGEPPTEDPPPEITPVPIPGALPLMATALAGLAAAARRRRRFRP
jgi:hypothetical protein